MTRESSGGRTSRRSFVKGMLVGGGVVAAADRGLLNPLTDRVTSRLPNIPSPAHVITEVKDTVVSKIQSITREGAEPPPPSHAVTPTPESKTEHVNDLILPDGIVRYADVLSQPRFSAESIVKPQELSIRNASGTAETDPVLILERVQQMADRYDAAAKKLAKRINGEYGTDIDTEQPVINHYAYWGQLLNGVQTVEQLRSKFGMLANPDDVLGWLTGTLPQDNTDGYKPRILVQKADKNRRLLENSFMDMYNTIFRDERDRVQVIELKNVKGSISNNRTYKGDIVMDAYYEGDDRYPIDYGYFRIFVHEAEHASEFWPEIYNSNGQDKLTLETRWGSLPQWLTSDAVLLETLARDDVFPLLQKRFLNDKNNTAAGIPVIKNRGFQAVIMEWKAEMVADLVGTDKQEGGNVPLSPEEWNQPWTNLIGMLAGHMMYGERQMLQPVNLQEQWTSMEPDSQSIRRKAVEEYIAYDNAMNTP